LFSLAGEEQAGTGFRLLGRYRNRVLHAFAPGHEAIGPGYFPRITVLRPIGSFEQLAGIEEGKQLREGDNAVAI
jgi:hypothetical protein